MTRPAKTILAALAAVGFCLCAAQAQGQEPVAGPTKTGPMKAQERQKKTAAAVPSHPRASIYYRRNWGVDIVGVHPVSSGYMLRFQYRVLDPSRSEVLKDRKVRPYLIDEKSGIALAVPAMEKVGELRQVAPQEVGRTYFVIFGNPARLVKEGDKVTLVFGNFRAEGIVVE